MRVGFGGKRIFFFILSPLSISPSCTVLNTFYPLIHVGYGLYRPFYTSPGTSWGKNGRPVWQQHQISHNKWILCWPTLKGAISKFFPLLGPLLHTGCRPNWTVSWLTSPSTTQPTLSPHPQMKKNTSLEMFIQLLSIDLSGNIFTEGRLFFRGHVRSWSSLGERFTLLFIILLQENTNWLYIYREGGPSAPRRWGSDLYDHT